MYNWKTRYAGLLLLVFGMACADAIPSIATPRLPDGPLPLMFQDPRTGVTAELSSQRVDLSRPPSASAEKSPATMGLVADDYAIIEAHYEDAGFSTRNSKPVAYASGWMRFFGNRGRVVTNMSLRRAGAMISTFPSTSEVSHLIPWHYEVFAPVVFEVAEDCGHEVQGTAEYRAWNQNQFPVGSNAEWLAVGLTGTSDLKRQKACTPEPRKDTTYAPYGGSGKGEGHLTDEWYFCMYEVWYNSSGQEIYRRLLYCDPI